ncbi:MAG: hypothetical protein IKU24_00880 [Clostridia bacterium]|nr:hypothetical protein [Clostridia bacterium]
MKMQDFIIPKGVHLVLDDIGWLYGRDQRDRGLPSRTGIPRLHTNLDDYVVVEEVGKKIGMKICCMMVIGEWDRRRTLAKVPGSSKWGKEWEKSEFYDEKIITEIRDFLNSAKHIELGFHGLLHDSWDENGKFICDGEFFQPKDGIKGNEMLLSSEEHIRLHMDAFYEIYNDWDLKCPIRTYASPCGAKKAFPDGKLTSILKDYGIKFWHNKGYPSTWDNLLPAVQNKIVVSDKAFPLAPWETYDLDPEDLPMIPDENLGILGGHWVNLLRYNPKRNLERVDAWGDYFKRLAQNFKAVYTEEIDECHYQGLYEKFAKVSEKDGEITIDLSKFDSMLPDTYPDLFINVKKGPLPTCTGGKISVYREQNDFYNLRIKRENGKSTIKIK